MRLNPRRRCAPFCLTSVLFALSVTSAIADCAPAGSSNADTIACNGVVTAGVSAGPGDDSVTVTAGALLSVTVAPPDVPAAAIDAGSGADTVENHGTVQVSATGGAGNAVCPGSGGEPTSVAGISGASGADRLINRGSLSVTTQRVAPEAAPVGGTGGGGTAACAAQTAGKGSSEGQGTGPGGQAQGSVGLVGDTGNDQLEQHGVLTVTEDSASLAVPVAATGIDGGNGDDTVVHDGNTTVTATVIEDNTALIGSTPSSPPDSDAPVATARGIVGGSGRDQITTGGSLVVGASATLDGVSPSLTLAGGDEVIATTQVITDAVGIDAGSGRDQIAHSGTMQVSADSQVDNVAVEVNLIDLSHADTSTTVRASAVGVDAGSGDDQVGVGDPAAMSNSGSITVTAESASNAVAVEANLVDAAVSDATLSVDATATGIRSSSGSGSDSGHNQIANAGTVDATATTTVSDVGVNVSFIDATIAEGRGSRLSTTLAAVATGIEGGSGREGVDLAAGSSVGATATSTANSVGVSLASEGVPGTVADLIRDGGLAGLGITSNSQAIGVDSGKAPDRIDAAGTVSASATSTATQASINVGIAVFDFHVPTPGLVLGSAGTAADATAVGLQSGRDDDVVDNQGQVDVDSSATASATTVSVNIAELSVDLAPDFPSGPPVGASAVVADTVTQATAQSTGIAAGDGDDRITNGGVVESDATATSGSTSAAATLDVKYAEGDNFFAIDVVGARSTTQADATATGITGGDGRDAIDSAGTANANATADGNTVSVGVVVSGTLQGNGGALNLAATDSSTIANARATALAGGEDDDSLINRGTAGATSNAEVDGVNVGVSAAVAQTGLVAGVSLARAVSQAAANSVGIGGAAGGSERGGNHGGEHRGGHSGDRIENALGATLNSTATADAGAVAVSVNLDGASTGLAGGAALVDASTTATANAVGIALAADGEAAKQHGRHGHSDSDKDDKHGDRDEHHDDGGDEAWWEQDGYAGGHRGHHHDSDDDHHYPKTPELQNAGTITVDAQAHTHSVGVSTEVAIAQTGVAIGAALARTGTEADAQATAILADGDDNRIDNSGSLIVKSAAGGTAVSVALNIAGTASGLAAGAALTDSSVTAEADATGIAAGGGDDDVTHTGSIRFEQAEADATAVSVSAAGFFAQSGVAIGAALGRTAALAETTATGIDGGEGDDPIASLGEITMNAIKAHADAIGVSLGVGIAPTGLAVSGALVQGDSTARVDAAAIAGGDGDDWLGNSGSIAIGQGEADADAVSVSVNVTGVGQGVALGGALVDADATATLDAAGLSGGDGSDALINEGTIAITEMKANSDAVGVGASLTVAGTGVAAGGAFALTGAQSTATVAAIDGGAGNDWIGNGGLNGSGGGLTVSGIRAEADAVGVSVGLSGGQSGLFIGAGLADASGTATARASGIAAGSGRDTVKSTAAIALSEIHADAHAAGVSVGVAGANAGVAAGVSIANTSGIANAAAFGVDGGSGDDRLTLGGPLSLSQVHAHADATSVGVSIGVALAGGVAGGIALADASANATAGASGAAGGSGDDRIAASGTLTIDGVDADATSTGVSVELGVTSAGLAIGGALADTRANATTTARGLDGGEGDDWITNEAAISLRNLKSNAGATGVGVALNGVISGGVAAGVSLTDASSHATTTVDGIAGGAGRDVLSNTGSITTETVESHARATGVSVSVQVSAAGIAAGAAFADTGGDATTTVRGMAGGEGNDTLQNDGSVTVAGKASADATSVAVGVSGAVGLGGGAQMTSADMQADSTVIGLDGGTGRDGIVSSGDVSASSTAEADSAAVSVGATIAIGGDVSLADARTQADATAVGIAGGEFVPPKPKPPYKPPYGHDDDDHDRHDDKHAGDRGDDGHPHHYRGWRDEAGGYGHREIGLAFDYGVRRHHEQRDDRYGHERDDDHDDYDHHGGDEHRGDNYGDDYGDDYGTKPYYPRVNPYAGDRIEASGAVGATATATGEGNSVGGNLFGFALGELSNTVKAGAFAIRSGDGDDVVSSSGPLIANARSTASGLSVAVSLGGKAMGDTSTTAEAKSAGIATSGGDDAVMNAGSITLDSRANASASGVSVGVLGVAEADASVTAIAAGTGIDGGDGDDAIVNLGDITVTSGTPATSGGAASCPSVDAVDGSGACARVGGVSVNLAGAGFLDATTEARSTAVGIEGGAGDDAVGSDAAVVAKAKAKTVAGGTNVNIFGAALSDAQTLAQANATGVSSGDGDDVLETLGSIGAESSGHILVSNYGFSLAGTANFDATLNAGARSTAIDGGSGSDRLLNAATLAATSTANVSSGGQSTVVFGASASGSQSGATADAAGLRAGSGDDTVGNVGAVTSNAVTSMTLASSTFSFGGAGGASGELTASSRSTGIAGEAGNDDLANSAAVTVDARSTLEAQGGSTVVFGSGSGGATSGATTNARGIAGDEGDDMLSNEGAVTATTSATLRLTGGSFTLGGSGSAGGELSASTAATALDGGSGEDLIVNTGELRVSNSSTMTATSNSDVGFGTSGANSNAGAVARANGIDAGSGNDTIASAGKIFVTTAANLTLGGASYTFGGTGDVGGSLNSRTDAFGIQAGSGNDAVESGADISVIASSTLSSNGDVNTSLGTSASGAVVTTDIVATGIDGGVGDDELRNHAGVDVQSTANVTTGSTTYVFAGSTAGDDIATATSTATGLKGGDGADLIINDGNVRASAQATISSTGASHAEFGSSESSGEVTSSQLARGVDAGSGDDWVINLGTVTAVGTASASMSHSTDTGFLFGDGDSRSRARTTLGAIGIEFGEGANRLENTGAVTIDLFGSSSANSSSDGGDIFDGDAFSRSDSVVNATAIGVRAGSGDDWLDNVGSIAVKTWRGDFALGATADADADGDGIDGDGTIRSFATTNLTAVGIDAGNGRNEISNSGLIDIDARARARATGTVDADAGGTARATRTATINASGFGIRSGSGDDSVFNTGTITVVTNANNNTGDDDLSVGATGISTGAGNDTIVNDGTITATRIVNSDSFRGTAINAGSGDDIVRLLDASVTNGNIDMGSGSDVLSLEGTPIINGSFINPLSALTLEFAAAGSFDGELPGVKAVKNGAGTFALTMLNPMDLIEVNEGTLLLQNDYQFVADGLFQARVFGDGSNGCFYVDGESAAGGTVKIARGGGAYRHGTRYEVFGSRDGIRDGSAFTGIELPAATPLLAFKAWQSSDAVEVESEVASFTTVVQGERQRTVAETLDRILPTVKGDLNRAMGEIQALPQGQHAAAFSGLSPEGYVPQTAATLGSTTQYHAVLHDRLGELRGYRLARSERREPVRLAYSGGAGIGLGDLFGQADRRRVDLWLRAFGQTGERDGTVGAAGFDYDAVGITLGLDRYFSDTLTGGISLGLSRSSVQADNSDGDVDGSFAALYGGYADSRLYLDATLSFGRNNYDTRRNLVVGPTVTPLASSHDGDVFSVSLGIGGVAAQPGWSMAPFAQLQYTQIDEDGFTENGSGAGLIVAARKSDALVSTIGIRFTRVIETAARGAWLPEASIGWVHDFGIDDQLINAAYIDAPEASFAIVSQPVEQNGVALSLGTSYRSADGFSTRLRYTGLFQSDFAAHGIVGELRWEY